jgi:anti-sigma B factor antagonist
MTSSSHRPDASRQHSPAPDGVGIVQRDLDARTSVISVEGELDLSTAPRLKWMLMDAIGASRDLLVVDLALATFIDSTALGVLVGVQRLLHPGSGLAIVCTRPNVLDTFEFAGLDGVFAIFATVEEALSHLRGRTAEVG